MRTLYIAFVLAICVFVAPNGASAESTMCTMEYAPVCGAHQVQCIKAPCYPVYQTYGNACVAKANDARILHEGECTPTETGPVKPGSEEPQKYVPPASCTAWYDGCNSCGRGANGQAICTLRACLNPGVGYCTAYSPATTTPGGSTDGSTSSPVISTTTASSHPVFNLGLWGHFFAQCARLFSWLPFWNK